MVGSPEKFRVHVRAWGEPSPSSVARTCESEAVLESHDKRRAAAALQTSWARRSHMDDFVRDQREISTKSIGVAIKKCSKRCIAIFCRVPNAYILKNAAYIRVPRVHWQARLPELPHLTYMACTWHTTGAWPFLARTLSYVSMPENCRVQKRTKCVHWRVPSKYTRA